MDRDEGCTPLQVDQSARNHARRKTVISLLVLATALAWVVVSTARDLGASQDKVPDAPAPGEARPPAGQVQIGSPAPDFQLTTLAGQAVRLSDFSGRPLVLNFFASWCDPCKEEAPMVQAMATESGPKGYSVLGVAIQDERAALVRFMQNEGLTLPVALDVDNRVSRAYRLIGPPATFFIDATGVIRHTVVGPLTHERVKEGLTKALGGAASGAVAAQQGNAAKSDVTEFSLATSAPGLALAAGAGLLSFLSPCCLPLLPAFMGYITGLSAEDLRRSDNRRERRRHVLGRTVSFALGLVLVFTVMGASASLFGGWLTEYRSLLARAGGLLVLTFGLHMMGLLHIPLLHREFRPGLTAQPWGERRGLLHATAMGAAFGLGWTPCVGPMLGSILFLATQEQSLGKGMLLLMAYGLGLGIPFVLTGLAADRLLEAAASLRRHVGWIEKLGGGVLVAMGILLVLDMLSAIALWFNRVL